MHDSEMEEMFYPHFLGSQTYECDSIGGSIEKAFGKNRASAA
jgi:hypothetical protein